MSGTATRIHVGDGPSSFQGTARFLDGACAAVRPARLTVDEGAQALVIKPGGAPLRRWPLADIRGLQDQAATDTLVLALADDPVARLLVDDGETKRLLPSRCSNLHRRPKPRGLSRLVVWAGAAILSVAVMIWLLVPLAADRLAAYLPPEGERALGATTLAQIRAALAGAGLPPVPICDAPEGRAALETLVERVAMRPDALTVQVIDVDRINAFALPGGYVTLFSGLIDAAETPDEVAAVLAHELGHVDARDPTRLALRSAGSIGVLGLLFGDFAGGAAVLFLVNRLIAASYSQEAEAAADAFAVARLSERGIDPGALADFFERLRKTGGDTPGVLAHFAAHPTLMDRIGAVDRTPPKDTRAALGDAEWAALQRICDDRSAD